MPRDHTYPGKDAIAGTPTVRETPPNRPLGGLPDPKLTREPKPVRMRRRGGQDALASRVQSRHHLLEHRGVDRQWTTKKASGGDCVVHGASPATQGARHQRQELAAAVNDPIEEPTCGYCAAPHPRCRTCGQSYPALAGCGNFNASQWCEWRGLHHYGSADIYRYAPTHATQA